MPANKSKVCDVLTAGSQKQQMYEQKLLKKKRHKVANLCANAASANIDTGWLQTVKPETEKSSFDIFIFHSFFFLKNVFLKFGNTARDFQV